MLKWRMETGVNEIREAVAGGLTTDEFPRNEDILRHYPCNQWHKTCKLGTPIAIFLTGRIKLADLVEVVTMEEFQLWVQHHMEKRQLEMDALSRETRVLKRVYCLRDMKGLGRHLLTKQALTVLRNIIGLAQSNYPESMERLIIFNAPWIFNGVYSMIRPLLAERTQKKIAILGDGYVDTLLEDCDADCLPAFFGGTCKCEGGCIPFMPELTEEAELTKLKVARGSSEVIEMAVEEDGVIAWNYKLDSYDLDFSITLIPDNEEEAGTDEVLLASDTRASAGEGFEKVPFAGKVVVKFDNSFSWTRGKQVMYKVEAMSAEDVALMDGSADPAEGGSGKGAAAEE
eukprot:PLAT3641.2.p1 GENE.PLAT3641.2~~PLAT3641.2.p1  ORF type:complete len:343 (-),score=169.53 PLAT3641.2:122-1150(-)